MKRTRQIIALLFSVAVVAALLGLSVNAASAITAMDREVANRYNIVFVNDESGSMISSDEKEFRYEAIRRFVALMAQDGNRIGSVSFNERIVDIFPMTDVTSFDDKTEFVDHISQFSPQGNVGMTNVGLALKTAVELLDSGRNAELPSIIILLTDGDTQMPSEKEKEVSLAQKADAIEAARKAGYSIYSICLGDGAHGKELKQISSATGGEFEIVRKAEDLEDVQVMFYKIIFNALTDDEAEVVIDRTGKATQSFEVPGIGVEELNIIIEGEASKCSLEDPDGRVYGSDELKSITMVGKDFRLIKVTNPVGGKWTATAYGNAGVKIKFKPLYNSSFYINTSMDSVPEYQIGDFVSFEAVICDQNGPVTDTSRYGGFRGILHVSFQGEEELIDMKLGADGFTIDYKIENDGTYYAYITVNKDELNVISDETYKFSVNNRTPVPPEEEPVAHANIWPFFGGTATLDLTGTATDPDGDSLTYTIDSTAFNTEDYTYTDNVLSVENFSIKKGSFTIRATDSRGAYCTFDVLVASTNIGLIMFISLCMGALIVLTVVIYTIWRLSQNVFNGDVTLTIRNNGSDGDSDTKEGFDLPRGSTSIEYWDVDVSEYLPRGTRIQAGGRKEKCIYLITKKPVYNEMQSGKKRKKHKIRSNEEIIFNMASDTSKGVRIGYTDNTDKMW